MELAFEKNAVDHLQKLVCQVVSQEETAETVVPDSLPDVGRIVGCWGVPVVRSKEWRQNGMGVSGGVSAWVLYVPEEGGAPRQVAVYLPFTAKWEFPPTEQEGQMQVSCRIKSIDARMVNSRKILVRASLTCKGEAYGPGQAVFYTLPSPPKELEVLRQGLPLQLPTELTEKSFLLDEELELPGGAPAVSQLVSYQVRPMVTDAKVLGEKAVFKGSCSLHVLYMTPEDRLAVWDFDLPFSQYTELARVYDQEEELQIEPVLTGVEVSADEEGRRLRLKCSVAAQCLVLARQTVDLVQDLYSLRHTVTPQLQKLPMKSRLDRQQLREQAESSFPLEGGALIDSAVFPDLPKIRREGEEMEIESPVWCSVLYYDEAGELQGRSAHTSAVSRIRLAEGCTCEASSQISGPLQWSSGVGSATVRASLEVTVDSFGSGDLEVIAGAELSEQGKSDPNRPSLIIRAPLAGQSLWDLAKSCGSTVEAIRGANHLPQEGPAPESLLLIPVF